MNAWIRLIRPVNALMGFVATYISALVGIGLTIESRLFPVSIAALCVFLVTGGGNVINDLSDIETDRINHPTRPIASGKISIQSGTYFAIVLFAIPVVISVVFLPILSTLVVIAAIATLVSYEKRLKRLGLSGNVAISILVGLIFIFGGISVNSVGRMIPLFFMAFLTNTSRELTKDIEDIEGDLDRDTFPKKYGFPKAAILATVLTLTGVSISCLPYFLGFFGLVYLIIVFVADAVFVVSLLYLRSDAGKSQTFSKLAMITGLIAFTVGGIL